MSKYDMEPHIGNMRDFVGSFFMRAITMEAEKHQGDGGKFKEQFPGIMEAHKKGEIDICLTVQGVEVDFVSVMETFYKEYRKGLAEDARAVAKSLISKPMSTKLNKINDLLGELERINEWYEDARY